MTSYEVLMVEWPFCVPSSVYLQQRKINGCCAEYNVTLQIVLIGDPKQLRPVVTNVRAKKLGLAKSLFERYFETHRQRVMMLNEQYRMVSTIIYQTQNLILLS